MEIWEASKSSRNVLNIGICWQLKVYTWIFLIGFGYLGVLNTQFENTETWIKLRFVIFSALNTILILILHIIIDMGKSVFLITNALSKIEENSQKQ